MSFRRSYLFTGQPERWTAQKGERKKEKKEKKRNSGVPRKHTESQLYKPSRLRRKDITTHQTTSIPTRRERHDFDLSPDPPPPGGGGAAGRRLGRHPRGGADAGDADVRGEARALRRLHELDEPAGHVLQPAQAGRGQRTSLPLQPLQHPRPARLHGDRRHPGSPAHEGMRRLHRYEPLQRERYASIVINNNTTSDAW